MMTLTLEINALESLERSLIFLKGSDHDPYSLKWFIIAFHHAMYCFMLAALAGTAQEGIWKDPVTFQERDDNMRLIDVFSPKNKLIAFPEAYKRIKDPEKMKSYVNSQSFVPNKEHDEAMEFLNHELRNVLMHFKPIVTGMGHDYIAECAPAVDVLDFLIFNSGQVTRLPANQDKAKIRSQLDALRLELRRISDSGSSSPIESPSIG